MLCALSALASASVLLKLKVDVDSFSWLGFERNTSTGTGARLVESVSSFYCCFVYYDLRRYFDSSDVGSEGLKEMEETTCFTLLVSISWKPFRLFQEWSESGGESDVRIFLGEYLTPAV